MKIRIGQLHIALALAAALLVCLSALPAAAKPASDWTRTEFADLRLVSAVGGTQGRTDVPLGLEFRLAEGWKVYWRSAGDAGYPPQVTWDGSQNLAGAETLYPVPHRFSLFGLETFGYKDQVVYPITAGLARPGEPLRITAQVNALACSEICVPLDATLSLDLPAGPAEPTAYTQLLNRWTAQVPRDLPGVGLDVVAARASGDPASPTLVLTVAASDPIGALDVFPEGPQGLSYGKPEITLSDSGRSATVRVPVGARGDARLDGADLRLTLVDGARFVERPVTVTAGAAPAGSTDLWLVLGFALLGGLILNLMPCVLPVLSLKLVSVLEYGGAERGAIRHGFLASAAGIVASFLLLAGILAGLKTAGVAVGWGIQFQQPLFLAAMATIVLLFAANLWGWFEVALPRALADLGGRLPAEGGARGRGLVGHFLTGAFAALLATPCSAPFLGTAVGFAMARGSAEIVAVFAVMGIGLALPYLAVAAMPSIARALPRPGGWMIAFKRVLALALLATGVWLLTVLAAQIGQTGALVLGALFLASAVVLALLHRRGRGGAGLTGAALLVTVLAVAGLMPAPEGPGYVAESAGGQSVVWTGFDRAAIDRRVADGEVVFVDVSADWCITCKVNKRLVLEVEPVSALLTGGSVTPMQADWTNPDPAISDYLASFGRYGIPFNAVYGPGAPDGIALPELLSAEAVTEAIGTAAGADSTARLDSSANRPM
ncbi:protein-disulfide reductase DsbD family protein [Thalassobaculum sp. OXR-137]|uniref:protein-disulfide reductase DsbD family protein n=1 Tax=Thalassobaculum sp. OXR-137 TaxID=3100173 RepID=UPI002AC9486A|nr:protein-disulfide reductase DsbD domain-containing protein [Thalassobaculum sp. OXR-137]WPZ36526.1 protein-disulfide reductase DsbD family protein [Thalassobaculum sp. OXR-137]